MIGKPYLCTKIYEGVQYAVSPKVFIRKCLQWNRLNFYNFSKNSKD